MSEPGFKGISWSFGASASNPSQDAYEQLQKAESSGYKVILIGL